MIERKSIQKTHRPKDADIRKNFRRAEGKKSRKSLDVPTAFIITSLLLTLLFAVLGFYPFGTATIINSDLSVQYAPDLVAYKNQLLSGELHSYSSMIGMGKNVFGLFAYYLASPVNFVTFLFPTNLISEAILVLITIKLSLAAAFMTLFLRRRFHTDSKFAILFGIVYATCSYALVYMINIMWLDGFLLLPLLLYFTEQYLEDLRCWKWIVLTLLVMFVSGFYIAYIAGVFSFLYVIARLIEDNKFAGAFTPAVKTGAEEITGDRAAPAGGAPETSPAVTKGGGNVKSVWKTVGIFIGSALLAAGISAAVLIPAGLDILGNPDHTAQSVTVSSKFSFLSYLDQLLTGSFDSLSNNKPLVFCGLSALFLCVLFFLNPYFTRRQKALAGGSILFLLFSFNFSLLDFAWHLFDVPNWFKYRDSFLMVFVILVISFASLLHLQGLKPRAFIITGLVFSALLFVVQGFGDLAKEGDRFYAVLFVGILELLCLFAMSGVPFHASIANLKKLVPALLVITVCLEVIYVNPLFMRPKMFGTEADREHLVHAYSQAADLVQNAKSDAEKDGVSFCRMEADGTLLDGLDPLVAGLYLNYHSISTFNSSANKDLDRYLKQLGFNTNYNYFTSSHTYSSVVTDSLLGIRYVLSEKKDLGGYELIGTSSDGKLYLQKNSQVLPLMYLVNSDARNFDFFSLEKNTADKDYFVFQNNLLVSLFGDKVFSEPVYYKAEVKDPKVYNAVIKEPEPKPVADENDSSKSGDSSDAYSGISDDSSRISESISAAQDKDLLGLEPADKKFEYGTTYLRESSKDVMSLTYTVNITKEDPLFLCVPAVALNDQADLYLNGTYCSELSSSMFSQVLSLGTFKPGETVTVSIRANVDTYSILPAQFYYCDTSLFAQELKSAVSNQDVQITKQEDGYVTAQVTAAGDQLLLTTIPYEKGWTLLVDGVKTDITPYQDAFICVPLSAGTHEITLSFTAPGMWAGAAVSGASVIIFAGILIFTGRKRSRPL